MNDAPMQDMPSQDDRTMAMIGHLLGIVIGFLGPLIIWLVKKDQSAFVDDQGKEGLNFQITVFIGWMVAFVTSFILIGFLLYPVLLIANVVLCILAGVAANKGERYRYPFALRLIK
jgi:uncharacterized protein